MSRLEVLDVRSRDTLNGSTAIAGARSMATRGRGWCHRLQRPGHSGNRTASARRCRASQRRYSKWTNSRRSPTVATSTGEILARKGLALQSPRPSHDAERNAEGRSANRTLPPCPDEDAAHPASSCLSLRTSSTRRRCTVTGRQQRAKVPRSRDKILRQRSATSRAESKSMWSNWPRRSSIPIPTP